MAGLVGRYLPQPGSHHGRERGVRSSPRGAERRHRRAQPPRTPHLRGAAPGGRPDDAGRPRRRIRRVARARAADRGPRLREGAVGRERHDCPAGTGRIGSRALISWCQVTRRKAGGNAGFFVYPVVLAKAGTHTPYRRWMASVCRTVERNHNLWWLMGWTAPYGI